MFSYSCSQNQSGQTEEIIANDLKIEEKDTLNLVSNRNEEINQEFIDSNSIFIPKGNYVSIDGAIKKNEWIDARKMFFPKW